MASHIPRENAAIEKYLLSYRVNPCSLYLEQRCDRKDECFDYHAPNQRRRSSYMTDEGNYNYNADVYCTAYDEMTGFCADGIRCRLLHKNAGNTELLYHVKYYKTMMCTFLTDENGRCGKNGVHCPHAHGPDDLRDGILEMNKQYFDDLELSRWKKPMFVFSYYKTFACEKEHCARDLTCPGAHSDGEKRRNPLIFAYSTTPCVDVEQESMRCGNGDSCPYSHTVLERLYHLDKFKVDKCKFRFDRNFCPRGDFCQFAHSASEIEFMKQVKDRLEKIRLAKLQLAMANANVNGNDNGGPGNGNGGPGNGNGGPGNGNGGPGNGNGGPGNGNGGFGNGNGGPGNGNGGFGNGNGGFGNGNGGFGNGNGGFGNGNGGFGNGNGGLGNGGPGNGNGFGNGNGIGNGNGGLGNGNGGLGNGNGNGNNYADNYQD